MKKINILLISSVALLYSCSSWLDVNPKTTMKADEMFQTQQGFNDVLIGVYSLMATPNLYADNLTFGFLDVLAQYYEGIKNSTSHKFINTIDYKYEEASEEARLKQIWRVHYKAIANINAMMLYFDNNKAVFSTGVYEVLKGEAIALRAYLHFNLLRLFGQSPLTGMDTKSIPYVDIYTNVAQKPLTVREVLVKVINDLKVAKDLMKNYDPYGVNYQILLTQNVPNILIDRQYRMNYYAVTAALSTASLYAGNKTDALSYAKEILGAVGSEPALPFKLSNITSTPLATSEFIFALSVPKLKEYTDVYFGADATLYTSSTLLAINTSVITNMYLTPGASSIDMRPVIFFAESSTGNRQVAKFNNQRVIPIMKISELYLIAAETEGSIENSLWYFNKFIANRGIVAFPTTMTREALDIEIYKEYKKEFIGEGKLFWFYKRLNYNKIGASDNYTVNDSKKVYTLPIPTSEYEFGNM
ncbi:MAG: RagB/SusD family nutrient uptake outer membrane protein [Bacteroidales bacterium]|nr:RagB/SusD family nutrient uptake outer membrane protein [Bacteroidales bacterium]